MKQVLPHKTIIFPQKSNVIKLYCAKTKLKASINTKAMYSNSRNTGKKNQMSQKLQSQRQVEI